MDKTYQSIAAELRRRIVAGEYPLDRPLPAERTLGAAFDVHRATLRRAVGLLESEGIVRRTAGDRPYPCLPARTVEGTIGLYASNSDDPYSRSIIATGIVEFLRSLGSRLHLTWSDDHTFRAGETFSPEFRAQAGLVLWPPLLADIDRLRELRRSMPIVIVDTPVGGFETDFVGFDDEKAGYDAARHLVECGHRRIAFVGTLQAHTARFRRHGFVRLMEEAGIEPVVGYEPLADANRLPASAVDAFLSASDPHRPTALLCENDETAALLMPHLAARGLRVPDDFALVGFGGTQLVLLDALGLTTMEQPYQEVGRQAARLLLRQIEEGPGRSREEIRLPMKLRARASSATSSDAILSP